jgi:hypothetical protein
MATNPETGLTFALNVAPILADLARKLARTRERKGTLPDRNARGFYRLFAGELELMRQSLGDPSNPPKVSKSHIDTLLKNLERLCTVSNLSFVSAGIIQVHTLMKSGYENDCCL